MYYNAFFAIITISIVRPSTKPIQAPLAKYFYNLLGALIIYLINVYAKLVP